MTRIGLAAGAWLILVLGIARAGGPEEAPLWTSLPAGPRAATAPGPASFAGLVERVRPAVVAVLTSGGPRPEGEPDLPFDLWRLFPEVAPQQRVEGIGSGFVIHPDGWVLTNHHVIDRVERAWVRLGGLNRRLPAKVIGSDARSDLALLKVESPRPLVALPLGDSDRVRPGAWVLAIGNPLGLSCVVTKGIVSGKGRALGDLPAGRSGFTDFIQTDAAIDMGNSGGPLLNLRGEVIGINTAINSRARGIGFAVPANLAKAVLPHLRRDGKLVRSYFGITIDDLDWEMAESFGLKQTAGVVITEVRPDTPAARAGLAPGDVILRLGGAKISGRADLAWRAATRPADVGVELVIWRAGRQRELEIVPAQRASDSGAKAAGAGPKRSPSTRLGLRVVDLDARAIAAAGLTEGTRGVVVVGAEGQAAEQGLRLGDVITEVNGRGIGSGEQLRAELDEVPAGGLIRLYVLRQRSALFVALRKTWGGG